MTFQVYLGIQFIKGLSIIYEHSCSHPVTPYFQLQGGIPGLNSAYNRVYFELKGTLDF
jgi:hypothetical protein